MILLLCRALGEHWSEADDFDASTQVLLRQRQLAEYVEMIYSAQAIHRYVYFNDSIIAYYYLLFVQLGVYSTFRQTFTTARLRK